MPVSRWERWAPIAGVLAVALLFVGIGVLGGNTPNSKASASKVIHFYTKHRNREMTAAFVAGIGAAVLLFFVSFLRSVLASASPTKRLANTAFGGGVVAVAGFGFAGAIHLALADQIKHAEPATAHTLNILDTNSFLPFALGVGLFALASGWSIARTRVLPLWLGIIAIVGGVAAFTPLGFFGFLLCVIWILITSIYLVVKPVVVLPRA